MLIIFAKLLAAIFNKTWLKRDLVFHVIVIFVHYKMINLDSITNKNNKEHNEKWPFIPDHPYRTMITGGPGSGKTNALLNLINEQDDIDKMYLYAKDLSEPKYEFLIEKRKNDETKHLNDPNALIECLQRWMTFIRIFMFTVQTEK